jgi:hypothetical protein
MKKSGLLLVIMVVMMGLVGCQKRAQVTRPKGNMMQIVTHQQSPFFKAQQKRLDHFVAHKMVIRVVSIRTFERLRIKRMWQRVTKCCLSLQDCG